MKRDRILHVDGPCLASAFTSGAEWVASKRLHLNEINVFPVPDGDTGNNLTVTLAVAARALRALSNPSLPEVCDALSSSVLAEAHGNAGIILAQFIRVFSHEAGRHERLYPRAFVEALRRSVSSAYEAMAEPVEGTILTVARESVDEAARLVEAGEEDFRVVLGAMHRAAAESLERTPELLPVLGEAGVVDAGGEGFVDLLEGILRMLRGDPIGRALDDLRLTPSAVPVSAATRDLKYRYCTEFMLSGPRATAADVRLRLAGMGGSLVAVGSSGLVRVHIHVNEPKAVFAAMQEFGEVSSRKIEDMKVQHRDFVFAVLDHQDATLGSGSEADEDGGAGVEKDPARAVTSQAGSANRVHVVTDSAADLSDEEVAELGVTVVPLTVTFEGGDSYRSGTDLSRSDFYRKLNDSPMLPTTSQPSPDDFLGCYRQLHQAGARRILSIHISSEMSGTVRSALKAAGRIGDADVAVVDSRLVSAPLGMVVIEAARAARGGADMTGLRDLVADLCGRARVYFTVGNLRYLVKGGRIGRAQAALGWATGARPILTIEDGVVAVAGRALGHRGVLESMLRFAHADLDVGADGGGGDGSPKVVRGPGGMLGLVHASSPESAERAGRAFAEEFGFDDVRSFELGGVVGTHAGPGAWGVSYFRQRPIR
jgi:uncharacterized protein